MSRNPATLLLTVFVVVASSASTLLAQYGSPCVTSSFTVGSASLPTYMNANDGTYTVSFNVDSSNSCYDGYESNCALCIVSNYQSFLSDGKTYGQNTSQTPGFQSCNTSATYTTTGTFYGLSSGSSYTCYMQFSPYSVSNSCNAPISTTTVSRFVSH